MTQTMKNEITGKVFYMILAIVTLVYAIACSRSARMQSNVIDLVILSQIFLLRAEIEGKSNER